LVINYYYHYLFFALLVFFSIQWIDWHPRGYVLLAGGADGTIWMWTIPTGKCMQVFTGHVESVTTGQFTPDGIIRG